MLCALNQPSGNSERKNRSNTAKSPYVKQGKKVKLNPAHRPSSYQPKYANIAFRHSLLGATDKDLAKAFEVDERTINDWKKKFPQFSLSIKKGKEDSDTHVANSLYGRATGYSHDDVDIRTVSTGDGCSQIVQTPIVKHYPPDVTAQIFWLKNRNPARWRDKQPEFSVTVNNDIQVDCGKPVEMLSEPELREQLAKIRQARQIEEKT